jgi:hypothetical protein
VPAAAKGDAIAPGRIRTGRGLMAMERCIPRWLAGPGGIVRLGRFVPPPDAALGGGDGAARHPHHQHRDAWDMGCLPHWWRRGVAE